MRIKRALSIIFSCVCCLVFLSMSAFAANDLTPYQPGGTTEQSTPTTPTTPSGGNNGGNGVPDYAGQLFQETEISPNETVQGVVSSISNVASALITFVLGALTSILTIGIVIDICCLLIKPLTSALAKLPIQLFSDEVSAITGIQYTGSTEGGSNTSVEKVDLKGKPVFLYYLEKKAFLIIPSVVILILLGTGLLFKGVFFVSNHIVSIFANLLG